MRNDASFTGIFRELSSLLGEAWREISLSFLVNGGATAIGVLAGLAQPATATLDFGFNLNASDDPASSLFELVVGIATIVANYFLLKRYLAAKGRLQGDGNRFWPYLGMVILSGLAIVLGIVLLIVPGLFLLVRWSAASGYAIGASQGVTESLTSSWNATKGHGWPIFFAGLALYFGTMMVAGLIGATLGLASPWTVNVIIPFIEAASNSVFMAFGIAVYCLVEDDTQQLSEVFA
jgi:hypothetical protein